MSIKHIAFVSCNFVQHRDAMRRRGDVRENLCETSSEADLPQPATTDQLERSVE
jgi:hypothetical protein